jgi:hypothetical protein
MYCAESYINFPAKAIPFCGTHFADILTDTEFETAT